MFNKILFLTLISLSVTSLPILATQRIQENLDSPMEFNNYLEFLSFIATNSYLDQDLETLFTLAAESTINLISWNNNKNVHILKADYFGDSRFSKIRGAQSNGLYYIFFKESDKIVLVGIMRGNYFKQKTINGNLAFTSFWHASAFESGEHIYIWNGKIFEYQE